MAAPPVIVAKLTNVSKGPGRRERAFSQHGQINDIVSADWNASAGDPNDIKEAINRLAAQMGALATKLNNDTGVADTDYDDVLP